MLGSYSQKWILCMPERLNLHLKCFQSYSSISLDMRVRFPSVYCSSTSPCLFPFHVTLTKLSGSWDPAWRQCRVAHSFGFLQACNMQTISCVFSGLRLMSLFWGHSFYCVKIEAIKLYEHYKVYIYYLTWFIHTVRSISIEKPCNLASSPTERTEFPRRTFLRDQ